MMSLSDLKKESGDKAKIIAWLDSIGADAAEKAEVIEMCSKDIECRRYYVGLHDKLKGE